MLLSAGFLLAWAAALGWLLLTTCRAGRGLTRLETWVFSTAVGLGLLSTWTLLLGLFGQLGWMRTVLGPATLTFAAAACVWYWRNRSNRSAPTRTAPKESDWISRQWLWLGLPFVLAILLAAMLPPIEFDVCEYHLQAPKEFFLDGQIRFLPHNVYANMALGAEMLSLLGMVLVRDWWWGALVGKTVIAAFTPLCALGLLAAGRRFYSTGAGVVAALVYISIPWLGSTAFPHVVNVSCSGLVEGASACYLFLALYAVLLSRHRGEYPKMQKGTVPFSLTRKLRQPPTRELGQSPQICPLAMVALAGYLAGAAVSTKYPAVLFVLIPLAIWVFVGHRPLRGRGAGDGGRETGGENSGDCPNFCASENGTVPLVAVDASASPVPRPQSLAPNPASPVPRRLFSATSALAVFLLAAAMGCGLWFAKNWVLTGNPTYPLLYGVFDGASWNADKNERWNQVHLPHDFSGTALVKDLGSVLLTSEWSSPLVVPLAVLAFFGLAGKPLAFSQKLRWQLLAYAAFVVAVWWLCTHRIDRFWLPVLPVLALLAGAGACWSSDDGWRRLVKIAIPIGLAANFLVMSAGPGNAWFVPLDQLRNDWNTKWHWYFNNDAAAGTVLTVGDAEVFDLKPPVLYNTCFDDCIFEQLVKGKTAKEIRAEFASRHIAYVFVNWHEIARYRRTYGFTDYVQPEVFHRLVRQGILKPLSPGSERGEEAYRVRP